EQPGRAEPLVEDVEPLQHRLSAVSLRRRRDESKRAIERLSGPTPVFEPFAHYRDLRLYDIRGRIDGCHLEPESRQPGGEPPVVTNCRDRRTSLERGGGRECERKLDNARVERQRRPRGVTDLSSDLLHPD